jgi:amino acid transporter
MYGEVRGADSVKKVHLSFQMANIPLNILNVLLVFAIFNTVGFQFFQSSNYLFWLADAVHMPLFPSIPLWVYFATGSLAITSFIMIFNILMGLPQNGAGNGYLIVSRMLFAMSFDQALPSLFAGIKTRWRVPMSAYVYTFVIALIFSWLYSYNVGGFRTVFLDSTGVLLIAFTVTAIAAVVLPFRRRDIFKASPASKYMIGGLPLMSLCGLIYIGFSLFTFYYWIVDPLYGVNNPLSAELLATVYVLGLIIFFAFKYYRKHEGIDLNLTYKEVPAE